ncbi:hypothetical protein [Magnetospirillum moscoviense]|uniref:Uncharacterized protein n=1 Tax=Magnetospirillum moscoviense TaxID=1437059 RepID=A0A178MKR9_9PROT|nr:hypothetical protein [Magnetospirillum moscoviense]OAN48645.1 hypothetical protein A6A05_14940 [Magnetospirillum moscoviense]
MTTNIRPAFIIDAETLSDLDELSTRTEHGRDKHGTWHRFEVNGVPLTVSEWGIGSGWYTLYEADDGRFRLIEADTDELLRHINKGFPRVSGTFPMVPCSPYDMKKLVRASHEGVKKIVTAAMARSPAPLS